VQRARGGHIGGGTLLEVLMEDPELEPELEPELWGEECQEQRCRKGARAGAAREALLPRGALRQAGNEADAEERESADISCPAVGQLVDGRVTYMGLEAATVDLVSGREGVLQVPSGFLSELQEGDEVKGMLIDGLASDGKVLLTVEDLFLVPDEEVAGSAAGPKSVDDDAPAAESAARLGQRRA